MEKLNNAQIKIVDIKPPKTNPEELLEQAIKHEDYNPMWDLKNIFGKNRRRVTKGAFGSKNKLRGKQKNRSSSK